MENSENVKVNNRNKRESIVRSEGEGGGADCTNPKGYTKEK